MNEVLSSKLIQLSEERASQMGIKVCIAVVDDGALLSSFKRMDGAFKGSIDVAISKARTSALFPFPTGKFGESMRNNNLTGMEGTNGGLCGFAGGFPVKVDGEQLGAIGISGGTAEQDAEIAEYALSKI